MNLKTALLLIVACAFCLITPSSSYNYTRYDYVVDVRFYVDDLAYLKYQEEAGVENLDDLRNWMQSMLDDINTNYMTSLERYEIFLKLRLEEVIHKDVVQGNGKWVYSDTIWLGFEKYLQDNKEYSDSFDVTMLLTGLDLYMEDTNNVYGKAFLDGLCNKNYRSGITEITADRQSDSLYILHEIGHILGLPHDTIAECGKESYYEDANIMCPVSYVNNENRFKFSYCSVMKFWDKFYQLNQDNNVCIEYETSTTATTAAPSTRAPTAGPPTETPDEACQRISGADYRFYRYYYTSAGYGNFFCSRFFCIDMKTRKWSDLQSPDGIPCATDKRCRGGKCVDDDPTPFNETCPWGDQDITAWNYPACSADSCGTGKYENNLCCSFCPKQSRKRN